MKNMVNKSTFKTLGGLSLASILVQSISFLATFYLAKIYHPENFGTFSSFLSWISILSIISTLHFEYAIVLAKSKNESKEIFQTVFTLIVLFSVILLSFCVLSQKTHLIIYPLGVIIFSFNQIFEYYFIKNNKYKWVVFGRFISITTFILQYIFGIYEIENGLVIGYLLSLIAQFLCQSYFIEKDYFKLNFKIKKMYENYKLLFNYGFPSTLIDVLSYNSIPILILTYFSSFQTGIYFMASKLLGAGILFISSTFSKVYHLKAATFYSENNFNDLLKYSNKNLKVISSISILIGISIYMFSIFGLPLISSQWSKVPNYVLILMPYFIIRMIYNPFSYLVDILKINKLGLFFNIFQLFCTSLGIIIGYLTSNLKIGLIIISGANTLIISAFIFYFFYKINNLSYQKITISTHEIN